MIGSIQHSKVTQFSALVGLAVIATAIVFWFSNIEAKALNGDTCNMTVVSLGRVGFNASCKVVVKEAAVYSVFLEHYYAEARQGVDAKQAQEQMREALGTPVFKGQRGNKYWTKQTHPVTARLRVTNTDTGTIYVDKELKPEAVIKGKYSVMSELAKVDIPSGTYHIDLALIKTNSALHGIETKLKFSPSYTGE